MAHTHDEVDWAERLPIFRRSDELHRAGHRDAASRLTAELSADPVVVDVGCGAGGMAAELATALVQRGGGTVVLVDAVEEMLAEAERVAKTAAAERVRVRTLHADVADAGLGDLVPAADLVWASRVLHHLRDQQAGVDQLAALLRPGGMLAVAEGGLGPDFLPWDLGVGPPGLAGRLEYAREQWFSQLRSGMDGVVRMPYGWSRALATAGLADVGAFTVLVDHPAPAPAQVREWACDRLAWAGEVGHDWLDEEDQRTIGRLVDPDDPAYLGARDDVFFLAASTVHHGRRAR